jgi:hypothetical protein
MYISVSRNPENRYTLLHKPLVAINGSTPQMLDAFTFELLNGLRQNGLSAEDTDRAQREIENTGQATVQVPADAIERVLGTTIS